jgi:predicted GNAT family acetyltransferase
MRVHHDTGARRFTATEDGHEAVLDYSLAGNVMTITHTGVPPAIRARGIAAALMQAALEAARDQGWTVVPVCSYAVAYMRRHPDRSGRAHTEALLDEALDESFPASDPPSVGRTS